MMPLAVRGLIVLALLLAAVPRSAGTSELTGDILGVLGQHTVAAGDTLVDLARRYDLGFVELRAANPEADTWAPPAGTTLVLPTAHLLPEAPRQGIVINLAELRLYYFDRAGTVVTFPIGIGGEGWETPVGQTRVVGKRERPTWTPPPSIRAERPHLPAQIPPGPNNPLGDFALDLGWRGYLLHGTNTPDGVGRRVSHGCIRLYPEDIAWLFPRVAVGTPVTVVDQPVKAGWSDGALYVEVHPTQTQADAIEAGEVVKPDPATDLDWRVQRAAGAAAGRLDWPLIRRIAEERRGVPVRAGPTPPAAAADGSVFGRPRYLRSD
jgi:L,D-transpeptidase ErfK/SrfK